MYAARSIQCVHAVRHLRGTVRVAVEDHTGGNATEEGGSLCNDNNTFEWRDTRRRHALTGNDRENTRAQYQWFRSAKQELWREITTC